MRKMPKLMYQMQMSAHHMMMIRGIAQSPMPYLIAAGLLFQSQFLVRASEPL